MGDVVSFRPTDEEARIIERTRVELGLKTRAEAIRHLIKSGAPRRKLSEDPVFGFRAGGKLGRSLTSREIDDAVYGGLREG
jgi:hypothetical protein